MMQASAVGLALYVLFFREISGCPAGCTCTVRYSGFAANCAYGSFQLVPVGLPSNLSRLTLSANAITFLPVSSFEEVPRVSSLWLAHNEIKAVQQGTFAILGELKSLDMSHNQLVSFPWEDLVNLTNLNLLKIDNNWLSSLPRKAFSGLTSLRSLHLNNNRLTTIFKGTFDPLGFLSNLQIHNNLFNCTCLLEWLKEWTNNTHIVIAQQQSIVCSSPKNLRGIPFGKTPNLQCSSPSVGVSYNPTLATTEEHEDFRLMLHCNVTGSPSPTIKWIFQATKQEICDCTAVGQSKDKIVNTTSVDRRTDDYLVFQNRTLLIPHVSRKHQGIYSCAATNEMGTSEASVEVSVARSLDSQHYGMRVHSGNATGGLQHHEILVISLPGGGSWRNRGETLKDASTWIVVATACIFIL